MKDLVLRFLVQPLFMWAHERKEDDAFFMLIWGDNTRTDVAYANSEKVLCDGVLALTQDPKSVVIAEAMEAGIGFVLEDMMKDKDFEKKYKNAPSPSSDDEVWFAYAEKDEDIND